MDAAASRAGDHMRATKPCVRCVRRAQSITNGLRILQRAKRTREWQEIESSDAAESGCELASARGSGVSAERAKKTQRFSCLLGLTTWLSIVE